VGGTFAELTNVWRARPCLPRRHRDQAISRWAGGRGLRGGRQTAADLDLLYRLTSAEARLVQAMDGTATVADPGSNASRRTPANSMAASVVELVRALDEGNFFTERFVRRRGRPRSAARCNPISPLSCQKPREFVRTLSIEDDGRGTVSCAFLYQRFFPPIFLLLARPRWSAQWWQSSGLVAFVAVRTRFGATSRFAPKPSIGEFLLLMGLNRHDHLFCTSSATHS